MRVDIRQATADLICSAPELVRALDAVCEGDRSPLVLLTCAGRARSNRRHDTGAAYRFRRYGDGWSLVPGQGSAGILTVDQDRHIRLEVACQECGVSTVRSSADAVRPLVAALLAWSSRRRRAAELGERDAGRIRAEWY